MPEFERRVKVYEIKYVCDECGLGNMERNGSVLMSDPPQYTHVCDNCGVFKTFRNVYYPHLDYRNYYY